MICPTCNQQIPDGSAFCPACGATFAPAPEYQPAPAPAPKKAPNKKLIVIAGAVVAIALVVVLCFTLFGGASGAAGIAQEFVEADFEEDIAASIEEKLDCYPQFYIDKLLEQSECDDIEEYIEKMEKLYKEYEENGSDEDDIEYSYDIIDVVVKRVYNEDTNKSEFKDSVKNLEERYDIEKEDISELADVTVIFTASYEKEKEGEVVSVSTRTIGCIKYDGNWYVLD